MEIFITNNTDSLFIDILTKFCGDYLKKNIKVSKLFPETASLFNMPDAPFAVLEGHDIVKNTLEISEILIVRSNIAGLLLGKTKNDFTNVFDFCHTLLSKEDKQLEFLNEYLLTNTYCIGFNLSLADIFAASRVMLSLHTMSFQEKVSKYANALRWYYHLQNLPELGDVISTLGFKIEFPKVTLPFQKPAEPIKAEKEKKSKEEIKDKEGKKDKSIESKNIEVVEKDTKKEKKTQEKGNKPKVVKCSDPAEHPVCLLDLRVGKIISAVENIKSEKLINEEIDIGGEIRTIASGIKNKVPVEDLKDSLVIVLCNLPARELCGWNSFGMLICATGADGKVAPLRPPEGSKAGDIVTIGSYVRNPLAEINPKKSPWDKIKDLIKTDDKGIAKFEDVVWMTQNGAITCKLENAKIS